MTEKPEDEQFALGRLKAAAEMAGFDNISFEFEPIAAAYHYEKQLDHDELVLTGDFGGASDFSLILLGPSGRKGRQAYEISLEKYKKKMDNANPELSRVAESFAILIDGFVPIDGISANSLTQNQT